MMFLQMLYRQLKDVLVKYPVVVVSLIHLCFILVIYHDVVFYANQKFLWINNDGLNNYYMFSYYVKHNVQWFIHEGMSLHFGEYIFLTDSHPLFAIIYRSLSEVFPSLDGCSVGFLNMIILFTPIISSFYLFKILNYYKIPFQISIPGSIGIALMSSQLLSIKLGHFALSYSFFIPISLWQLLNYMHSPTTKRLMYNVGFLMLAFFTHMYHGLMIAGFQLAALFFFMLFTRKDIKRYLSLFFSTMGVLVFVAFIMKLDPYPDRRELAMNLDHAGNLLTTFVANNAGFLGVFQPWIDLAQFNAVKWARIGSYIGISPLLFLIVLFGMSAKQFLKRKKVVSFFTSQEWSILLGSFVLLLFSYGFPSILDGGFIFDLFPIIYQIIALSRFGFPFYYVVAILTIVFFYRIIQSNSIRIVVGVVLSALFIIESVPLHLQIKDKIGHRPNMFNEAIFDKCYHYSDWNCNVEDYVGILPLPIFIFHGVPFVRNSTIATEELAMATSMRTGLPINAVYLARPSIGNSKVMLDFVENKTDSIVQSLYGGKKMLVTYTKEVLRSPEQLLLSHLSDTLFVSSRLQVFSLENDDWIGFSDIEENTSITD